MLSSSVLASLLLALAVSANPVVIRNSLVTLPLSRRLNLTSPHNLVRHDQTRVKALRARAKATNGNLNVDTVVNAPVTNQAVAYVASISIGSPSTAYSLLIDTGSSNTWSVAYGSGSFSGTEFTDTVTIAHELVIHAQSIGVASKSTGFNGVDGILGIGPVDLTIGTLSDTTSPIPTVTDELFSQREISANKIGISFEPTTTSEEMSNGELTWGGIDESKFTGTLNFAPITTISPASEFWGITQTIRYGASTHIQSSSAGIVDTGTTLVLIASDAFQRYRDATGAVLDNTTGLLRITAAQFSALQSLFFTINGVVYELTPNAQLWPRSLNAAIGGTADSIYLIVANIGTLTGEGLDFVNGYAFLERFYSVFDTTNKRVGLATTPFTHATTN
ncbi:aspartic peptidase A1 [Infundibulicybe gibba]|nr:aspartic peptidase A1 [Infundibulicybe gibba]